ncbi:MAG: DUF1385 domain-containing protein [Bacillota bacterium]
MKDVQYGGQAVIEGVMMRGEDRAAVAVRKSEDDIVLKRRKLNPLSHRFAPLGWPFIRGVVALFSSLVLGIESLSFSASQVLEEEEEELTGTEIFLTILASVGMAVLLFIVLPAFITGLIQRFITSNIMLNITEGMIKISTFLLYILFISRMEDISRVFSYHGAEHKVIHNYESERPLTVENARTFSTLHPRCGTSFIFIVILLSIFFFSFFGRPPLLQRIFYHIILLPVVAGSSYEIIKLAGKSDVNPLLKIFSLPGLYLQKLTTNEPDDSMLEVAIRALEEVLPAEKRGELDV